MTVGPGMGGQAGGWPAGLLPARSAAGAPQLGPALPRLARLLHGRRSARFDYQRRPGPRSRCRRAPLPPAGPVSLLRPTVPAPAMPRPADGVDEDASEPVRDIGRRRCRDGAADEEQEGLEWIDCDIGTLSIGQPPPV